MALKEMPSIGVLRALLMREEKKSGGVADVDEVATTIAKRTSNRFTFKIEGITPDGDEAIDWIMAVSYWDWYVMGESANRVRLDTVQGGVRYRLELGSSSDCSNLGLAQLLTRNETGYEIKIPHLRSFTLLRERRPHPSRLNSWTVLAKASSSLPSSTTITITLHEEIEPGDSIFHTIPPPLPEKALVVVAETPPSAPV